MPVLELYRKEGRMKKKRGYMGDIGGDGYEPSVAEKKLNISEFFTITENHNHSVHKRRSYSSSSSSSSSGKLSESEMIRNPP